METHLEQNLKGALIQLKVTIHDIDRIQNDSVDQCDELDCIKENVQNAILLIKESLKN